MDSLHSDIDTLDADIWPVFDAPVVTDAAASIRRIRFGEAAAPDIPASVGRMILAAYAMMMAGLLLFFTGSLEATMMVVISIVYTAIYLAVPAIVLIVERRSGGRTMGDFFARGLDCWTGHIEGREALLQMLLIPAALITAILVIGIAAAIIL